MTALEIVYTITLWIIIGLWISYKRNWYQDVSHWRDGDGNAFGAILANVVFMPIMLLITLFFEFLNDDWKHRPY